jgi:HAD superfamily hydrolase (TIGR01509 family)
LPGAVQLLRWCRDRGLETVLASSASAAELAELRATLDADDAVSAATGADDADAGKPAPDILRVALDRTGLAADRAVFVGDSVWDGQAAARAGVAFVAVTCGGTSAAELRENGAVEVWRDPADLLRNIGGSALTRLAS